MKTVTEIKTELAHEYDLLITLILSGQVKDEEEINVLFTSIGDNYHKELKALKGAK